MVAPAPCESLDRTVLIVRCTAKLFTFLGLRASQLPAYPPGDDDWYANILWIERRRCLLVVHAGTLFSAFAGSVRKADLTPFGAAVARLIEAELAVENLHEHAVGGVDAAAVQLAATASKVTLGYLNEIARFFKYGTTLEGGLQAVDVSALNRAARRELHLARRPPGYIVPIELARARNSSMVLLTRPGGRPALSR